MKRIPLPPCPPSFRQGVSLIELIITIGVAGVILTMGIGTLHLLLRTDDNLHHSLKRRQTVSQLSDAFRDDIHAARHLTWNQPRNDKDSGSLTVQLAADHKVQYTIEGHTLIRTETRKQQTLQTARFRFSRGTEILFEPSSPKNMAVRIRTYNPNPPRTVDSRVPKRELRIQAIVGRDHRFEKTTMP